MLRKGGSTELQKLLSIEFHTQLLSRDSEILFPAVVLAKGQFSHDLCNFFNPINEITFPSRQPIFFPSKRADLA